MDALTFQDTFDFESGELLLLNKPLTWTSFDVVNKIRHLIRRNLGIRRIKVGHTGTLDPLATGLLLICTGKYTKRIGELLGLDKEYAGKMILGATTSSYDAETDVNKKYDINHISENLLIKTTDLFTGDISQIPPVYSAIKIEGIRAYRIARKDQEVKIKPRDVKISKFTITDYKLPEVSFLVECSKGTYIRSLVHDFGQAVNSGAYLNGLCRTRIGPYKLEDAMTIEQVEHIITSAKQNT